MDYININKKMHRNKTQDWGFDAIFNVKCPNCGNSVEFFKDEIKKIVRIRRPEYVFKADNFRVLSSSLLSG